MIRDDCHDSTTAILDADQGDGKQPPRTRAEALALFEANRRLVGVTLFRMGLSKHAAADDMNSAGQWGLWVACERWREGGGMAFKNFAITAIRQHVLKELARADLIRVPAAHPDRAATRQRLRPGRLPTAKYDESRECSIADHRSPERADEDQQAMQRRAIGRALGRLKPAYADAIQSRYLDGMTLAQIAAERGTTREAVRQLLCKALRRLRQIAPRLADLIAA